MMLFLFGLVFAQDCTPYYVSGYTRSDGTVVSGYYRRPPGCAETTQAEQYELVPVTTSTSQWQQMEEILTNPLFRAWAESHGYELGEMRGDAYFYTKDDYRALRDAEYQLSGGRPIRKGIEIPDQSFRVVCGRKEVDTALYSANGKYTTHVFFRYPDGTILAYSLEEKRVVPMRGGTSWYGSTTGQAALASIGGDAAFKVREKQGVILTLLYVMDMTSQDISDPTRVSPLTLDSWSTREAKLEVRSIVVTELAVQLAEDPSQVRHVRLADGEEVTLIYDSRNYAWQSDSSLCSF